MLVSDTQLITEEEMPISDMNDKKNDATQEDGWYIYDGNQVQGPIADLEFSEKYRNRSDLFASKKGFSKWYKIDDINQIFSTNDELKRSAEMREFQKVFNQSIGRLQNFQSRVKATDMKPTTLRKVTAGHIPSSLEQMMTEETLSASAMTDTIVMPMPADHSEKIQAKHRAAKQHVKAKVSTNPKELYLTLKGRLRLGQITNTFDVGFINYLFTLSLSSFFWYRRLRQEMTFHIWGKYSRGQVSDILVLVPILNCFKFYSLATMMAKAEEQNQYKKIVPSFVFILGLVPPLAISYLQEMANKHWILHVVNVRKKHVH
jgi:hypothetical protein